VVLYFHTALARRIPKAVISPPVIHEILLRILTFTSRRGRQIFSHFHLATFLVLTGANNLEFQEMVRNPKNYKLVLMWRTFCVKGVFHFASYCVLYFGEE
jgi:hypothetical protein